MESYFCYLHPNRSNYALAVARRWDKDIFRDEFCVFDGCGWPGKDKRFRRLPGYEKSYLNELEKFSNFDDALAPHTNGELDDDTVSRRYASPWCLYIVTNGKSGSGPDISIQSVEEAADRWLIRSILFALDHPSDSDVKEALYERLQYVSIAW